MALSLALLLSVAGLAACGSHKSASDNAATPVPTTVSGLVLTEAGAPVAGAAVHFPSLNQNLVSDLNGTFALTAATAALGDDLPVLLTHPDYATKTALLNVYQAALKQNFVLRAHDVVKTITLPQSANDQPVVVSFARADGAAALTLKAGDLAAADGTVATGQALVKFSYWHPEQDFNSAPAQLVAQDPNNAGGSVPLTSLGMASIDISQNDVPLQVASGRTLALDFNQPAALGNYLLDAVANPNAADAPYLWYVDETTGLWVQAGSTSDGLLLADANTMRFRSNLPHLSAWNIDYLSSLNLCVQGKITDCQGQPLVSQKVSLWGTRSGSVVNYSVTTGADGTYCTNILGSSNVSGNHMADIFLWVTPYHAPEQASCSPFGSQTFAELCRGNTGDGACVNNDLNAGGATDALQGYDWAAQSCGIQQYSAPLCGFCAGSSHSSQCQFKTATSTTSAGDWAAGNCATANLKAPCTVPNPNGDFCSSAAAKHQGDPCTKTSDCCPANTLICADGLCVPNSD